MTSPSIVASSATVLLPPASIPRTCICSSLRRRDEPRISCYLLVLPVFALLSPLRVTVLTAAVLFVVAIGSPSPQAAPAASGDQDVRALWVTRATLGSPDAVTKMV